MAAAPSETANARNANIGHDALRMAGGPGALTVSVHSKPDSHDGSSSFEMRIAFSTGITVSESKLKQAFEVTNGTAKQTRRIDGRSDLWKVAIKPDGPQEVTIALPGNRPCGSNGVPCAKTDDGTGRISLWNSIRTTITGP